MFDKLVIALCLCGEKSKKRAFFGPFLGSGLLLLMPGLARAAGAAAEVPVEAVALASAPFSHTHEWLIFIALGLGGLNTMLLYLLNRSARPRAADAGTDTEGAVTTGGSSRTDRRMDKRKREIDDLRQQVIDLTAQLAAETDKRPTTPQIHEMVRVLVRDELTRTALPGSAAR